MKEAGSLAAADAAARHAPIIALARGLRSAVALTDARGRVVWTNESFAALTGYGLDELRGRAPGERLQGPDTDPAAVAVMRRALAAGEPFGVEVLNYTREGRQYWVRVEAQPLRDGDGALTGFASFSHDVSDLRIARARDDTVKQVGDGLLGCGDVAVAAQVVATQQIR